MPEYKPRYFGGGMGTTTPTESRAPSVHKTELHSPGHIFNPAVYAAFNGAQATATVGTANQVRLLPLAPLPREFTLDFGRIYVGTTSAGGLAKAAIYELSGASFVKVAGSDLNIPTDNSVSGGVGHATNCTLTPDRRYFSAFWCDNVVATFTVFTGDTGTRVIPTYRFAAAGISVLPASIAVASTTKNYAAATAAGIAVYFSKDMINII